MERVLWLRLIRVSHLLICTTEEEQLEAPQGGSLPHWLQVGFVWDQDEPRGAASHAAHLPPVSGWSEAFQKTVMLFN